VIGDAGVGGGAQPAQGCAHSDTGEQPWPFFPDWEEKCVTKTEDSESEVQIYSGEKGPHHV
jgi:hypothetical protein